ncbi:MAG: MBL fold metallo-hydrolase [candidate division Zixibacteria bacterium]|nr:MBL fold metallo-hydrolase [candidate division Zixibacteria bacterium]
METNNKELTLIVHRGTHEIGGSCIEISTDNSRIIIDAGEQLPSIDNKTKKKLGTLPKIRGVYKNDNLDQKVKGVLISHSHMDHFGLLNNLHNDIPIFISKASQEFINLSYLFTPSGVKIDSCTNFESGKTFCVGDFTITPYLVDHSAFDSYMFLIEVGKKRILYSGDFRTHGRKSKILNKHFKKIGNQIDLLLLEGTTVDRPSKKLKTETDIEQEIVQTIQKNNTITLVNFASQNIDRIVSFYKASIRTNKLFVIDFYTAHVLNIAKEYSKIPYPSKSYKNIRVYYPFYLAKRISEQGNQKLLYKFSHYKITKEEIANNHRNIIMVIRPSVLFDLKKIDNLDRASLIYSMWEGYLNTPSMQKLREFADNKKMNFSKIHTSGHADIESLKIFINKIQPRIIVPIHTNSPEKFTTFGENIKILSDGEQLKF